MMNCRSASFFDISPLTVRVTAAYYNPELDRINSATLPGVQSPHWHMENIFRLSRILNRDASTEEPTWQIGLRRRN
jgi:hypothetical protein